MCGSNGLDTGAFGRAQGLFRRAFAPWLPRDYAGIASRHKRHDVKTPFPASGPRPAILMPAAIATRGLPNPGVHREFARFIMLALS